MKGKKRIILFVVIGLLVVSIATTLIIIGASNTSKFRIIAPENFELSIGNSKTLDYTFTDKDEANRMLNWSSSDSDIAEVDEWGRVTGISPGKAKITASQKNPTSKKKTLSGTIEINVVLKPTTDDVSQSIVNYGGEAVSEVENLQKVVTRYNNAEALVSTLVPDSVKAILNKTDKASHTSCMTKDEAEWSITNYGVKRVGGIHATSRDEVMRFMGDRYFFERDTTDNKVLGIIPDGEYGIWTIMGSGITHIQMVKMTLGAKASLMSSTTQTYVSRRGMVAEANLSADGTTWIPRETDNDGLWTSMYGAGELFRYASLKKALEADPTNSYLIEEVAKAKITATLSTEAVLLLSNISMRNNTVEAYVRYQMEGFQDGKNSKYLSSLALIQGKDYSRKVPSFSPNKMKLNLGVAALKSDINTAFSEGWLSPFDSSAWSDPTLEENKSVVYAKKTRSLGGFIARTYSLKGEAGGNADNYNGSIYYDYSNYSSTNKTALGKSANEGIINNEDLKGVLVDASYPIPNRLWNDLLGSGVNINDIVYKGDTSTDEIIGHLFIYKIAYDILGKEDPELKEIISTTMDRFANHLSDNEYMLVDATGQPTTWGKMNREYFYSYRWGAPSSFLTASVLLCTFKVAHYVTGYTKWQNEYDMLINDSAYFFDDATNSYNQRYNEELNIFAFDMFKPVKATFIVKALKPSGSLFNVLAKSFAQYSDEEMAGLAYYLLFQLEDNEEYLKTYRSAIDQWWKQSLSFSENPFWYYVYQLAYPNKKVKDAYGNYLVDTAAWSLSRHPLDTRKWLASNYNRDDIAVLDLELIEKSMETRGGISYNIATSKVNMDQADNIVGFLITLKLDYAVAAPDERSLHKYNGSSYVLGSNLNPKGEEILYDYNPNHMEGSTTYTLPYWMGVYHGMLELSDYQK